MKKILALVLSALMILALVACGTPEETTAPDVITPDVTEPENNETPDVPASNEIAPEAEEGTWGAAFWADFKAAVAANKGVSAEELAYKLMETESGMAMGGAMAAPTVPGYQQGFMEEIHGFKTGAMFAPFAAGFAFMGYVFELEEGADVAAFVKTLNDNYDLRWMICMTAETATIGAVDNYVMAILSPAAMPGGAGGAAQVIDPILDGKANTEALWNDFVAYMEINGSFSLASDVADYLAGNELLAGASVEVLDEMIELEGFAWSIEAYTNGAAVKAGDKAVYVFQLEMGMMPDAWGDYNLGMNAPEGADTAWGAYGETLILMINIEA